MANKNDPTEEMIRQLQETRRNLTSSLYQDFFQGPVAAPAGKQSGEQSASSAQAATQAPKAPVQKATGPDPKKPEDPPARQEPEEDPMETLNNLIGLDKIKHDVKELTDFARIQKARQKAGLRSVPVSLHLVFTGNPGTGKTTVARILAKLYKEIGVLSQGQLIEVDRSGLVAGYVGQTALKTQEQIQKAIGGVLFIDEAYTLASKNDDFGQEAIDTILKAMEDHRDNLIVIVAGYTEPMERFINSNPGLKSRFNKYIEFPDYTIDELMQIFDLNCKKYDYTVEASARTHVREMLSLKKLSSPENFANARAVRNLFEEIITNQAGRIAAMENPSCEDLKMITSEDLTDSADEELSARELAGMLGAEKASGETAKGSETERAPETGGTKENPETGEMKKNPETKESARAGKDSVKGKGRDGKETTYGVPQDVSKSGICSKSGCREEADG